MANLWKNGFGNLPSQRPGEINVISGASTGRDGVGQSLSMSGSNAQSHKFSIPARSRIFYGVAINVTSGIFGATGSANPGIVLRGDSGTVDHLTLNWDVNGRVHLRRGSPNGAVIATSSHTPLVSGTWHYYEIEATVADAGGVCKVRLDGVEVINFTGDTKNGGTNTTIDQVHIGNLAVTPTMLLDDEYLNDDTGPAPHNTYWGDVSIRESRYNGNGAINQLVGSDGNSVDNHLQVDEVPYNTTDYNGSATPGQQDLYAVADISGATTVLAVQQHVYVAKTDAGARSIKTLMRAATGTIASSAETPLSTTYAVVDGPIRTTDPDNAALTQANINSAQFGVEVV